MQWAGWSRTSLLNPVTRDELGFDFVQEVEEPAIGMALYSSRAILHGRGGYVWEMVKENFL
jgi:hypothetical protein